MTLVFSPESQRHLHEIAEWTEFNFGPNQVELYLQFLTHECERLLTDSGHSRPIKFRPELSFVTCRSQGAMYGHYIVFRKKGDELYVVGIYHTAQDLESQLKKRMDK